MADDIYELEVVLLELEPPIWRLIAVPSTATLAELHRVVQMAMGWTDSHLHQFVTESGQRYEGNDPADDPDVPEDVLDAANVILRDLLRAPGDSLKYDYDFGDGWGHRIKLALVRAPASGERYPRCLAGERGAHRRIAAVPGAMRNCLMPWPIRSTSATTNCGSGLVRISTRRRWSSARSTNCCWRKAKEPGSRSGLRRLRRQGL